MALRKGSCYSRPERPYTRKSKVKSKSYIKSVPPLKTVRFTMGDLTGFNQGKYPVKVSLRALEPVQVRDNALEACRQLIHRELDAELKGNYCFWIPAYPHHVLRENKIMTGAGADRLQTGMSLSFGTPIGLAAQLRKGSKIFEIACRQTDLAVVREILTKVKSKLPGKKAIVVE